MKRWSMSVDEARSTRSGDSGWDARAAWVSDLGGAIAEGLLQFEDDAAVVVDRQALALGKLALEAGQTLLDEGVEHAVFRAMPLLTQGA